MKYKYKIIIKWSQEDEAFIAEPDELAGCMADGETQQEALENVHVVIDEWIETAKLKKPIYSKIKREIYAEKGENYGRQRYRCPYKFFIYPLNYPLLQHASRII